MKLAMLLKYFSVSGITINLMIGQNESSKWCLLWEAGTKEASRWLLRGSVQCHQQSNNFSTRLAMTFLFPMWRCQNNVVLQQQSSSSIANGFYLTIILTHNFTNTRSLILKLYTITDLTQPLHQNQSAQKNLEGSPTPLLLDMYISSATRYTAKSKTKQEGQ